jgi:hypothetical protein
MRTRQPTGPSGVLLKSKGPWKNSHALILGLSMACQRRLRMNSACGRRRSQRYGVNAESMPASIAKKWSLNVQIVSSARFWQCTSGGTSWNLAFHLKVMASFYDALASLSRIWRSTERPLAARHLVAVAFGLECLLENEIAISVEGNHDVLVF